MCDTLRPAVIKGLTKALIAESLAALMDDIGKRYDFDSDNGWAVRDADTMRAVQYGRFRMLKDIIEALTE